MTDQHRTAWLQFEYPLTILKDRYNGVYSGGEYVAFPLDFDAIDPAVGLGESPGAAFQDLREKMGREGAV